jgi:hypothetical protein
MNIQILNFNIEIISLAIGLGIGLIICIIIYFIIKKKPIKKEIGNARNDLRELYKRYGKELFDIADKIDKHLGELEK